MNDWPRPTVSHGYGTEISRRFPTKHILKESLYALVCCFRDDTEPGEEINPFYHFSTPPHPLHAVATSNFRHKSGPVKMEINRTDSTEITRNKNYGSKSPHPPYEKRRLVSFVEISTPNFLSQQRQPKHHQHSLFGEPNIAETRSLENSLSTGLPLTGQ